MERAIKTRIYPTEEQKNLINQTFGCYRFVYNKALEKQIERHAQEKNFVGKYEMCRWITEIKQVYDWLYEVDSRALQLSTAHLESAYKKFFKGAGFPKFKNKRGKQSYTTDSAIRVEPHYARVPKVGLIRTYERLDENIKPNSITISMQAGLYFASIQYDDGKKPAEPNNGAKIGVDLGVKDLATFSDGTVILNPKYLKKHEEKIKRLQRKLAQQRKGSNRRTKTKQKLARTFLKVSDSRKDYLHKATTMITKSYGYVAIENLNVSGMIKNHKLAKAISDCGFYEFRRQLEYKAVWYGSKIAVIGTFEPSSKTCSNCGWLKKDLILADRIWVCANCNTKHERDVNAAKNILNFSIAPVGSGEVDVKKPSS